MSSISSAKTSWQETIDEQVLHQLREWGLSPVLLFVYNRPSHTVRTLEALSQNFLARESELYVFSDGAKKEEDQPAVEATRRTLARFAPNFEHFEVVRREENWGLAESVISGVSQLMRSHGQAIVVEDDLLTGPGFLLYMNQVLNHYRGYPEIFSVSAYRPSQRELKLPPEYEEAVYFSRRSSSWGWGTWQDRWEKIDWEVKDYDRFRRSAADRRDFGRGGGDLRAMLCSQMLGRIDSWAIRFAYGQWKQQGLTVVPTTSLVTNIGIDGSGTHFKAAESQLVQEKPSTATCTFELPLKPSLHPAVDAQVRQHRRRSWRFQLKIRLKEILYPLIKQP